MFAQGNELGRQTKNAQALLLQVQAILFKRRQLQNAQRDPNIVILYLIAGAGFYFGFFLAGGEAHSKVGFNLGKLFGGRGFQINPEGFLEGFFGKGSFPPMLDVRWRKPISSYHGMPKLGALEG